MKQKTDKKYSSENVAHYKQTDEHHSTVTAAAGASACRCFRRIFLLCVCVIVGNTFAFCFEVVLLLKALCYPVYTTLHALLFTKCNARHHHRDTHVQRTRIAHFHTVRARVRGFVSAFTGLAQWNNAAHKITLSFNDFFHNFFFLPLAFIYLFFLLYDDH